MKQKKGVLSYMIGQENLTDQLLVLFGGISDHFALLLFLSLF